MFHYLRMFTPLFVFPPSPSSMLDSRQWIMHKDSQLKSQHWNRGGEESHTEVKIENLPMIFDDDCSLFLAHFNGYHIGVKSGGLWENTFLLGLRTMNVVARCIYLWSYAKLISSLIGYVGVKTGTGGLDNLCLMKTKELKFKIKFSLRTQCKSRVN